ncbi:hypothetical protein ACFSFZ_04900 [Mixta tenebrionis]|uniref:Uncharacterized protein n=1 Tax=Mixta tenebrionis TaxID=2562439 RepID=A0A506V6T1_9GAMM|nr:hypothetical protein [Mixta tenebrionis]TPW41355.1 hypothetical protein FKM52_13980 [Mixta tenebrionis]
MGKTAFGGGYREKRLVTGVNLCSQARESAPFVHFRADKRRNLPRVAEKKVISCNVLAAYFEAIIYPGTYIHYIVLLFQTCIAFRRYKRFTYSPYRGFPL